LYFNFAVVGRGLVVILRKKEKGRKLFIQTQKTNYMKEVIFIAKQPKIKYFVLVFFHSSICFLLAIKIYAPGKKKYFSLDFLFRLISVCLCVCSMLKLISC